MTINKKELYSFFKGVCKDYNASISIKVKSLKNTISTSASFDIRNNHIDLNINQYDSLEEVLSVFFHELGHLVNKEIGKYPLYHRFLLTEIPKNKRKYFIATALRAEQYTDQVGKKLMKIYFPDLKFYNAYPKRLHKKDLIEIRKEYSDYFKMLDQEN